jgi:hypothetical protein
VELTEDILKQLMELVFRLVCNGELSLARVLRKNILDKVEQKKQLRYTNSLKPLAARGVSARYRPAEERLLADEVMPLLGFGCRRRLGVSI